MISGSAVSGFAVLEEKNTVVRQPNWRVALPDVLDTSNGSPSGSRFAVKRCSTSLLLKGPEKREKASQCPSRENAGELSATPVNLSNSGARFPIQRT
jgi:hypothetical protein